MKRGLEAGMDGDEMGMNGDKLGGEVGPRD